METLKNYLENGLLIPIIYFLRRCFAFAHNFSGKEMIKLYKLIIECCNLRLYISDFKYDFWKEFLDRQSLYEENEKKYININLYDFIIEEEKNFYKLYNIKSSNIDGSFCINYL